MYKFFSIILIAMLMSLPASAADLGGRVLNIVIRSENFKKNREKAISLINKINWDNGFFRKDIGYKVIN